MKTPKPEEMIGFLDENDSIHPFIYSAGSLTIFPSSIENWQDKKIDQLDELAKYYNYEARK